MMTAVFFTHAFETTHSLHSTGVVQVTGIVASPVVRPFFSRDRVFCNNEHHFFAFCNFIFRKCT